MSASRIVYELHGSPPVDGVVPATGNCWVCAAPCSSGIPVKKWNGSSFTGQNRVRCPDATHVCEACIHICSRIAPVLGRPAKAGKKFGGNFRNYSHLFERDWQSPTFGDDAARTSGYVNASKGEKPLIREFLARKHAGEWFSAIADSGQKHVIPWTPMNSPGRAGRVLFDEAIVHVPDDQRLIEDAMELLTAGATKDEILRGTYTPRAWELAPELIRLFESAHAGDRHGSWFALAIWLAQRDEEKVAARVAAEKEQRSDRRKAKRKAKDADDGGPPRRPKRVPQSPRKHRGTETLGPAANADVGSSENQRDPGGVGDPVVSTTPAAGTKQLGLFGVD